MPFLKWFKITSLVVFAAVMSKWFGLAILILCGLLIFLSHWIFAFLLYVLEGLLWVKRTKGLPFPYKPLGFYATRGKLILFLLWPLALIYDFLDCIKMIFSDERYAVVEGEEKTTYFPDWDKAYEYARKNAIETKEDVMIVDQSKVGYGGILGASYFVKPDGRIERPSWEVIYLSRR